MQKLIHFFIMLTFFLAPMWLKWSFAPAPFSATYVLGFMITSVMLITIGLWILSGFDGWQSLRESHWHIAWCIFLGLLIFWSFLSRYWAFGLENYAGLAQSTGLQLLLVAIFSIVIVATKPPIEPILIIFVITMLLHGTIGGLQVIAQSDIGLDFLGEFALNPQLSGISVLESNGTRWLRPYGLLPHPNMLAGFILLGLFCSASWVLGTDKKYIIGSITFIIGFWFLLLTFSRGAWVGFFVGMMLTFPSVYRLPKFWKKITPIMMGTIVVGLIFIAIYSPLLLSRAGVGEQNTELRSVADRIVFIEIAYDAIETYPFQGVGMGNFAWYASNYIFYNTDYDLQGNNVHNIYLLVLSELGIIGFIFFMGMMISGLGAMWQKKSPLQLALLGGFIAWAVVGIFDHYMWTLVMTQVVWIGLLAVGMSGTVDQPSPTQP